MDHFGILIKKKRNIQTHIPFRIQLHRDNGCSDTKGSANWKSETQYVNVLKMYIKVISYYAVTIHLWPWHCLYYKGYKYSLKFQLSKDGVFVSYFTTTIVTDFFTWKIAS